MAAMGSMQPTDVSLRVGRTALTGSSATGEAVKLESSWRRPAAAGQEPSSNVAAELKRESSEFMQPGSRHEPSSMLYSGPRHGEAVAMPSISTTIDVPSAGHGMDSKLPKPLPRTAASPQR